MIEDPREVERRRLLGIEDADTPTREDLAAVLEEVSPSFLFSSLLWLVRILNCVWLHISVPWWTNYLFIVILFLRWYNHVNIFSSMFNVRLWEFLYLGNFKGWGCAPLAGYASKRDMWAPLDTLSLSKPSTSDNLKLAVATIYLYFPVMYNNSEWEFLQDALMTLLELTAYIYFQQEEWRPYIETFPLSAIDEDTSSWMNRPFGQEEV